MCAPTWPMVAEEDYNTRPHDGLQLYGQGAALLLESPYSERDIAGGCRASKSRRALDKEK